MSASQPPAAASTSALASGVASRFVSADALEQAKQKRAEEWKEAYKRLGQEPPPEMMGGGDDEAYDPRSLYERLQENKTKKQEAFEEQLKFKNHFRALDEEEISFLDSIVDDNNDEERERKKAIQDELRAFKQAVTKRSAAPPPPILAGSSPSLLPGLVSASASPPLASSSTSPSLATAGVFGSAKPAVAKPATGKAGKKRKLLPGVVVPPKKPKTTPTPTPKAAITKSTGAGTAGEAKKGEQVEVTPASSTTPVTEPANGSDGTRPVAATTVAGEPDAKDKESKEP